LPKKLQISIILLTLWFLLKRFVKAVLNTKKSRKAWIICKNLLILENHQILENLRKKQKVNKEAGLLIENLIKKIKKKEVRRK